MMQDMMKIKQLFEWAGIDGGDVAPEALALPVQVLREDSRQRTGEWGALLVWDGRTKPRATAEPLVSLPATAGAGV